MNKNAVVRVFRPNLNEEEQAKREQMILTALQQFGKAMQEKSKGEIHNERN